MGQSMKAVLRDAGVSGVPTGGWVGLAVISIVSGLVTGIAEALGGSFFPSFPFAESRWDFDLTNDENGTDVGQLDDNLTLPILSGGCIWGLLRLFSWFSS